MNGELRTFNRHHHLATVADRCSSLISMENGSPDVAVGNCLRSSLQANIEVRELEGKGRIAVYVGNDDIGAGSVILSVAQQDKVFLLNPYFFFLGVQIVMQSVPMTWQVDVNAACTRCNYCLRPASDEKPLQICSRCHHAMYCGAVCQRADWRAGHKLLCGIINSWFVS